MASRTVLVPASRVERWFENFADRHGGFSCHVESGCLVASAADGASCSAALPFRRSYDGPAEVAVFAAAAGAPACWGLLLVRKGGFAVARLDGPAMVASKVGRRHVQGRTKAGGQSQQRFARRRANQAREAFEAAAGHAFTVLAAQPLNALVCGGDRHAVHEVLTDPRLAGLTGLRTEPWLDVPDPRRAVLERAVVDGSSAILEVDDPEGGV
ncbi:MAG TPA: acVLRF1 family peptidyl-tRNA hydrolase [Nocardioidaceae bacterium]|nr:acVLRF1 family peptidyl-tRNA hydrolase [Nocardioidaceae bacterium]